jgi:hypothetical protein
MREGIKLKTSHKNNSKAKIITIIVIICIIFILVGAYILFYFRNKVPTNPAGTVGNTSGNIYNGGLFCESDGYVYFSNAYDDYSLYRMLPDETEVTSFVASQMKCINADGKYLYCYRSGSGSGTGLGYLFAMSGIYRIKKSDPSDAKCLDRISSKYVLLADNNVYYTSAEDGLSLKKVSTDGKNVETLLDLDILPVSVQNSTFYYMDNADSLHLMAYDLNSNRSYQVLGEDIYMPIIEGNTIYGIDVHDGYSLISLNVSDGSKTKLDSDRTDMLNVANDYIYYQTSGDNPQLKRIRRDGTDMEVVADGAYNNINATSRYVYFTKYDEDTPVYHTGESGPINVTTFSAASLAVGSSK